MSSPSPMLPISVLIPIILIGVCYYTPLAISVPDPYYDVIGWLLNLFVWAYPSMRKDGVKYSGFVTIISVLSIWIPFASFFAMLSARMTFPKDPLIAKTYQRQEKQRLYCCRLQPFPTSVA